MSGPRARGEAPESVADLLDDPERSPSTTTRYPTGFDLLDEAVEGGVRSGDLMVIGGRPGVGKTSLTVQWARWTALCGQPALYLSYEHEPRDLLWRLLLSELGALVAEADLAGDDGPGAAEKLRQLSRNLAVGRGAPTDVTDGDSGFAETLVSRAAARVRSYADRVFLVRGSGSSTGLDEIAALAERTLAGEGLVFIDHLHKVRNEREAAPIEAHASAVSGGLKDLALDQGVGVIAIGTVGQAGLASRRIRLHHLRGAEALAYEADIVLAVNEKAEAVSKAHSAFDPVRARQFGARVVVSIEKNRRGRPFVDLEFTKELDFFRFHPEGCYVAERLVDAASVEAEVGRASLAPGVG